jgi:cell division inhibitor SulA/protein ImuA
VPNSRSIKNLLDHNPGLWQGRRPDHRQHTLPSGHAALDACLPGRGWPLGAMTELISRRPGLGELSLLFPALSEIGSRGQWVVLVDPPWIPYPASLRGHGLLLEQLLLIRTRNEKESLWACEQALRGNRGGAVLAWPARIGFSRLRRLQLAAESNAKLAWLFRPGNALREASPAALRIHLEPGGPARLQVSVIKCRGSRPPAPLSISQPFSFYGNQPHDTGGHALPAEHRGTALLAGHPLPPPGPGSVHPGPGQRGSADRRQRPH